MSWIYYCTPFLKSNLRKDTIDRKINVVAMQILLHVYHRVRREEVYVILAKMEKRENPLEKYVPWIWNQNTDFICEKSNIMPFIFKKALQNYI